MYEKSMRFTAGFFLYLKFNDKTFTVNNRFKE